MYELSSLPLLRASKHDRHGSGLGGKTGYSPVAPGVRSYHEPVRVGDSSHLTAKTHQTVKCRATAGAIAALPGDVARKAMLKARKDRRDA